MNREQQRIEAYLRKKIEESELPGWKCPWIARAKCNLITGHAYSGGNAAIVAFDPDEYFLTFKQSQEIGGVKAGASGIPIPFYKMLADRENPDKMRPVMVSHYTVFGLSSVDVRDNEKLEKIMAKRKVAFNHQPIPEMDDLLLTIGAEFGHDPARAFYTVGTNMIKVPKLDQFRERAEYYRTCFHEIGHWTGSIFNLKRNQGGNFGSVQYAQEELVAEIYANYLSADFGLDLSEQSATYIKGWLKVMKDKPLALMRAFSDAQAAYKFTADKLAG